MNGISFGTDGWRAMIADQFTLENVRIVSQAIADFTIERNQQEQGLIVGYDTRFMGRAFAQEVALVLAANGIKAYLVNEPTPTPVVAFGVKHFAASGAVMITASHNPPEYNGIKYIPDYAGPAAPVITQKLEQMIEQIQAKMLPPKLVSLQEALHEKSLRSIYLRPHYEAHLRKTIRFDLIKQSRLRVVVDPMHGAGIGYVSGMLQETGLHVTSLHETVDPLFGGHLPEPTEEHLQSLSTAVLREQAAVGLANDGDADRFGVVDNRGKYLSPNLVLAMLARHLIKNRGMRGRIVRTVATSHMLDRIAAQHGLELVETPVGFKYIGSEMLAGNVLIGGEESGGCSILGHLPEKDGILTNLLVVEMCAWENKTLEEIRRELQDEYGEWYSARLDIPLMGRADWMNRQLRQPPAQFGSFKVIESSRTDGVKLLLDGGAWLLIRPSGTEPLVRIYCEAESQTALAALQDAVRDWALDGEE